MTAVRITGETLAGTPDLPLLVCGPGPGVPERELWADVAARLGDRLHVVTWECDDDELPDRPADLLDPVVQYIDGACAERGEPAGVYDTDVAISDVAALAHGAPKGRLVVLERVGGPSPLKALVSTRRVWAGRSSG